MNALDIAFLLLNNQCFHGSSKNNFGIENARLAKTMYRDC